ncbi:hypothetical protein BKA70DRAFT_1432655 [Coprinopsis sp. MPI-PUGE-AT-0042]|nr:hypothetical protein BKA70DRAFT_1432655 [Coprinopsis sp. MPI-PUGE-AT-0042]
MDSLTATESTEQSAARAATQKETNCSEERDIAPSQMAYQALLVKSAKEASTRISARCEVLLTQQVSILGQLAEERQCMHAEGRQESTGTEAARSEGFEEDSGIILLKGWQDVVSAMVNVVEKEKDGQIRMLLARVLVTLESMFAQSRLGEGSGDGSGSGERDHDVQMAILGIVMMGIAQAA